VARLATQGIVHSPFAGEGRACFEVYPHPAHLVLFGRRHILPVKARPGRTRTDRLAAFAAYGAHLQALGDADPPLSISDGFLIDAATRRGAALKRYEDRLDALTCAYVAWHRTRWGEARSRAVGDATTGWIVVPVEPERARRLTASFQGGYNQGHERDHPTHSAVVPGGPDPRRNRFRPADQEEAHRRHRDEQGDDQDTPLSR
jgi:predicted RNase H-like nuclease